jgi:F0F1-type ATP synthase assembly protein I
MDLSGVFLFVFIVGAAALIMLPIAHIIARRNHRGRKEFYEKHLDETEKQMKEIERQINPNQPMPSVMLPGEEKRTNLKVIPLIIIGLLLIAGKYNLVNSELMIMLILATILITVFMPQKKFEIRKADKTALISEYAKLKTEKELTQNAQKAHSCRHPNAPLKPYQILVGSITLMITVIGIFLSSPTKETPMMIIVFSALIFLLGPVIILIENRRQTKKKT